MAETPCIRLGKKRGELALRTLRELHLLDTGFRIRREGDQLLIPILRSPSDAERSVLVEQLGELQIDTEILTKLAHRPRTIFEVLKDQLAPHQLASLPRSIDVVGDIAVVELPGELLELKALIGKAILESNRNLRTVLAKAGPISTDRRTRLFHVIAGSDVTETTHREYGCLFHFDVTKVYFNPRLSFEHERVASQVTENETVVDMFAGVGPFAIHIAKKRKNVRIYAIDISEDAINYLRENILLNHVDDKVIAMVGDARTVIENLLIGKSDRVVMNLPARAAEYLDAACLALKPSGGIIHYYAFSQDPNPVESAQEKLSEQISRTRRKLDKASYSRIVMGTAPHEWLVGIDALVR